MCSLLASYTTASIESEACFFSGDKGKPMEQKATNSNNL